jgi:tetratricopeptide (TPR) repeat protein
LAFLLAFVSSGQTSSPAQAPAAPENTKADAYYNFAMGHLYAELAGAYGNRGDYLTKAIEHYRAALKKDPGASFLAEELTDLYIQAGRLRDAILEAEEMLKQNPRNIEARRILGRIYTRMIGDPHQGKINPNMLRDATDQFKKIVEIEPKDLDAWLTLGRLHKAAGNSVESEQAYNKALEIDPGSEDALTGLAIVYSDLGDTTRAIEKLKQLTDKNPSARTLMALGSSYEQMRDYRTAAQVYRRALELQPENARVKKALAQDLLIIGELDESLKLFEQLAADDPRDASLQLRIAEVWRSKRDFAKSRAALDKAKQIDGNSLEVRYDEVNLLDAEGKTDQAIALLKGIIEETARKSYSAAEKTNRAMLLERLGTLYRGANRPQEAVATFRQIADLDPEGSARVAVQIIDTYRMARDYKTAQQEADAALRRFPKDRMVVTVHASLLADSGRIDEAAAQMRSLLSGDRDRETWLALAQIYERGKRFADEAKALDEAEKLSTSKLDRAGVAFMRGAMYEKMKDFDRAEAEFRKVLADDPDNASALNYLGYMFADRDLKLEEARQLISRALELDPENGAYLDSLGWVYYRQNRLAEAETLLLRALERIGTDPTIHDHLGDVYFKQGKLREAVIQWQASLKEWEATAQAEADPAEIAKVTKKLESAKVKLARETGAQK